MTPSQQSIWLSTVAWYQAVRSRGSLWQRLTSGSWWSLVGTLASQGLSQAAFLVVARQLHTAGCGALGIVISTTGMFGLVAGVGMGFTSTKSVASFRTSDPGRAGRIIGLLSLLTLATAGAASVAVFLAAPFVAARVLGAPGLAYELRLSCMLLFFNTVNGVQTGALTGLEAFRRTAGLNVAKGVVTVPLLLAGAHFWSLPGAVCGYALAAAVGCVLNRLAIRRECKKAGIPLRLGGAWSERKVIWDFALPAFLGGIFSCPATWASSALLVNQPHGYESMGLFTAADKWRLLIAFVPSATSATVLSMLAHEAGKPIVSGFRRLFLASLAINSALVLPAIAFVMLFSSQLMALSGESFRPGAPALALLALSSIPNLLNLAFGQALMSAGKVWQRAFIDILWGLLLFVSAMWLVPRHGAVGLAGAYILAYSAATVVLIAYTYTHSEIPVFRQKARLSERVLIPLETDLEGALPEK
ncbi:MAG TPA: oligosaccharide flippase family protein [Bryobacteraceae bacterium]|nr:oligosaccharide flippase family protein [Bryobacteraceae bacterium]